MVSNHDAVNMLLKAG